MLIGVQWYLTAVLPCISLMSDELSILNLLLCHLHIFFSEVPAQIVHFYSGLFSVEFENFVYSLAASSLSDMCSANMSSWSVACLFISLTVCFKEQTF